MPLQCTDSIINVCKTICGPIILKKISGYIFFVGSQYLQIHIVGNTKPLFICATDVSFLFFYCRCGNINWAKRMKCNICNTNKPGHNEAGVRYYMMTPSSFT